MFSSRFKKIFKNSFGGMSTQSAEMRPNLFFIDFHRFWDRLFIFLRCFFVVCFPFFG